MKKYLILLGAGLLSLAACNKTVSNVENAPVQRTTVTLRIAGTQTRAVEQTAEEAAVNSLQVLVFRDGGIETYASATGTKEVVLSTTSGSRSVYAVVNAPSLAGIEAENDLKASLRSLSDNSASNYVMAGHKNLVFAANNPDPFPIPISRLAIRVEIDRIVNNLANSVLASKEFKVNKIFLTNVNTKDKLIDDYTPQSEDFIHHTGALQTDNSFVYKSVSSGVIAKGTDPSDGYNTVHSFYGYQNPQDLYSTMLIVEVKIGDKYYNYPLQLGAGALESNRIYRISELQITRLGNDSNGDDIIDDGEIDPITVASATVEVSVEDWTVVLVNGDGKVVM